jgi:hypothetical protein
MFEDEYKSCDYCDSCKDFLKVVEIYFNFGTVTHKLCEACIKHELKDEGLKYTIIGEKK